MSRQLKFRAWQREEDEEYSRMISSEQGVLTAIKHVYGGTGIATGSGFSDINNQPEPGRYELMQYTGLKDKNGNEIYEGDIVKTHFSFNHNVEQGPFIITWNKDKAMFEGVKPEKNKDDYLRRFSFFPEQEFIYEIVGNIYENPELLKEG